MRITSALPRIARPITDSSSASLPISRSENPAVGATVSSRWAILFMIQEIGSRRFQIQKTDSRKVSIYAFEDSLCWLLRLQWRGGEGGLIKHASPQKHGGEEPARKSPSGKTGFGFFCASRGAGGGGRPLHQLR